MSRPDLFHLSCACLHPHQVSPICPNYPLCIYTSVFCLSVASSSSPIKSYQCVFPSSSLSSCCFLVFLVLTILPALNLPWPVPLYNKNYEKFTIRLLCLHLGHILSRDKPSLWLLVSVMLLWKQWYRLNYTWILWQPWTAGMSRAWFTMYFY